MIFFKNFGILIGLFFLAFLVGSIPFGVLIPLILGKGDPRTMGSKNIGASNVYRLGGLWCGLLVYILDMLKGYGICLGASFFIPFLNISQNHGLLFLWAMGFFVVAGHVFSLFLKGKGGKGAATASGVLLALCPMIFLLALFLWMGIFLFFHWAKRKSYASVASLTTAVFVLGALMMKNFYGHGLAILPMFFLLIFAHRENIERLAKGKEIPLNPNS